MTNNQIWRDCLQLSSGTMATLTGLRDMGQLDTVQADFAAHVLAAIEDGKRFETWIDAWWDYRHAQRQTAVVTMQYDDDAHTCTLAEWITANSEDEECMAALPMIERGETVIFGGGAAPLCHVTARRDS